MGAAAARVVRPLALLAPLVVGIALRVWRLPEQILGGDEINALHAATSGDLASILVTYRLADHCIPLTALYRAGIDAGVVWDESSLRAPILATGILLLVLAPWAVQRALGSRVALAFAWLLALSPLLVLYSRIVRSYLPLVLFGAAAGAAFYAWWRRGGRGRALAYLASAALAGWFHLGALPFVAAPFAYACGAKLAGRGERSWREILTLGLLALAAVGAFLVPARVSLRRLLVRKSTEAEVPWSVVPEVLAQLAGTPVAALAVAFWALAAVGVGLLVRRRPDLVVFWTTLCAGQVAGLLAFSPIAVSQSPVVARYLLPCLPPLLVAVAVGLTGLAERLPGRAAAPLATAAVVAALLFGGPLLRPGVLRGSFAHHSASLAVSDPGSRIAPSDLPAFYRGLDDAAPGPLLEYPWHPIWAWNHAYRLYQVHHGRPVLVGTFQKQPWERRPGVSLGRHVPVIARDGRRKGLLLGAERALLEVPARWLVIHRSPGAEEAAMPVSELASTTGRLPAEAALEMEDVARALAQRLAERWGPPDHEDDVVVAYDLDRVRARRAR